MITAFPSNPHFIKDKWSVLNSNPSNKEIDYCESCTFVIYHVQNTLVSFLLSSHVLVFDCNLRNEQVILIFDTSSAVFHF